MKKTICLMMLAALLTGSLWAKPVSENSARRIGAAFLTALGHPNATRLATVETEFTEFYVFSIGTGGFVLVSADDCVRPILGYSLTGSFSVDNMPTNVHGWLEDYQNEILYVKEAMKQEQQEKGHRNLGDDAIATMWQQLAVGAVPEPQVLTSVSPLVTTTWNQSPLYNDLCPYDSDYGQRVVTGCVATATAQIMKYWNYPTTGYGSHSYTAANSHTSYGTLSANFGNTTYAWASMPSALTSISSQTEINAVATLIYHVGVGVEMIYNVASEGGSSAYNHSSYYPSAMSALVDYFKYSPDIVVLARNSVDDANYCALLRAELDQNRPILYDGRNSEGGHSFVCDGYDQYNNFHFNWGWGGAYDGFYAMGALYPGYSYNSANTAMIGIRPNTNFGTGGTVTVNSTGGNTSCSATGSGTYTFGDSVTLVAVAGDGYRFAGWNDNCTENPRIFTMTGGNYSFTALFETIGTDTMSYCGNMGQINTWGEYEDGVDKYWGIKLPASSLTAGQTLTAVDFYVGGYSGGYFDMTVYTGTTGPTEQVYSTSVWVYDADLDDWYSIYLPTAYTVEAGKSLWLTFHNSNINFPAAITTSCGNPDGFLYGPAFNPDPEWNLYTFMIRGRFSNPGMIAQGDTISYCGNKHAVSSWNPNEWGIMIPSAELTGRNYLTGVKLFSGNGGIYTLRIYKGGATAPGTLVHTQPADIESYGWNEVWLDNIVPINANDSLWITLSCSDGLWPALMCRYTGNTNSDWVFWGSGSWEHVTNEWNSYSWMIKAVTSATTPTLPPPTVVIRADQYVSIGTPVILTAEHSAGTTVTWNIQGGAPTTATGDAVTVTWNQTGWHQVTATVSNNNGTGSDELWVNVVDCDEAITTFPYVMDFETSDNMVCVNMLDADNDGEGWVPYQYSSYWNQRSCFSQGWTWANDNYQPRAMDNWLILPKMTTTQGAGYSMEWYDMAQWMETDHHAHYGVYIDTTCSTNTANYVLLAEFTTEEDWWIAKGLDLSAYAGKTFRLAFRHYNNGGTSNLCLDYIKVNENIPFFREGDTISYCGWRTLQNNLGYYNNETYWGVKFTPSRLAGCDSIKSVLLYVLYDGTYTLTVAQGGDNAPGTPLRTQTVTFSGQYGWQEILLSTPAAINGIEPLWVTFYTNASRPAAYTQFSGDENGDWLSNNGSNWLHASYYNYSLSWMVKAVMSGDENCSGFTLPYSADFTQCWKATGGATVIDSNHAALTAQGQRLTSPWMESVPGTTFINWQTSIDEDIWGESGRYTVTIESEYGETIYNEYFSSYNGWFNLWFNSPGGRIRVMFERTGSSPTPSFQLNDLALFSYPISLTVEGPTNTVRIGDTVTFTATASLPNGDTADYWGWDLYWNNQWIEDTISALTVIAATNNSRTVVFHDMGNLWLSVFVEKYDAYGQYDAYSSSGFSIHVYDSATVDCDHVSLPYTADFTQCWSADGGATIIDPQHAQLGRQGQMLTSPWFETVPGKTFISWETNRDDQTNWTDDERYYVAIYQEDGEEIAYFIRYASNNYISEEFNSPGGRIQVVIFQTGNAVMPSFTVSNLKIFQYDIDINLDFPGMASVGDTVTITIQSTLQNGDTPDYTDMWMYDLPNYSHNLLSPNPDDPTITVIGQTDNSITLVWNTAGRFDVGCSISKYLNNGVYNAYATCRGIINIVNRSFYEEDSIYYTSAAKDTVIGCHSQLHTADLPASVRVINDSSFYELPNLSIVNLPDGLTHIGHRAFYYNQGITEITIPRNVQFIGDNAFCANYSLTTVNFNAENCLTVSPTTESDNNYWPAFINCSNIHSIHIGQHVKRIPDRIFWGCYGLRGTLVIPDSVTYIGYDAFTGWNNSWAGGDDTLSVVIGKGVNKIGNYAFGTPFGKLTSVISRNPVPPTIYSNTFYVRQDLTTLTVPCGSTPAYRAASYWIEFLLIYENCNSVEDVEDADGVVIYNVADGIVVSGAQGQEVNFYDINGRLLQHVERAGENLIFHPFSSGVYLVRTGNITRRVVVIR